MRIEEITKSAGRKTSVVYVAIVGENIMQNFTDRRSRPVLRWRDAITPTVLEFLDLPENEWRLEWDQKAGCTCGCSPGFHIVNKATKSKHRRADIWVKVSGDHSEMVSHNPVAEAAQAERASALESAGVVGTENFSQSICDKFPVQTGRHVATPQNARWMLRNVPVSPFSDNEKEELKRIGA